MFIRSTFGDLTAAIQLISDSENCVMVGGILHLTCIASNTLFMAWGSIEYIGSIRTLDFKFTSLPGVISRSSKVPTAFATFLNASGPFGNNNVYNLESQLQIEVLATYTQFAVSCINPGKGSEKNITFYLKGKRFNEHHYLILCLLMS